MFKYIVDTRLLPPAQCEIPIPPQPGDVERSRIETRNPRSAPDVGHSIIDGVFGQLETVNQSLPSASVQPTNQNREITHYPILRTCKNKPCHLSDIVQMSTTPGAQRTTEELHPNEPIRISREEDTQQQHPESQLQINIDLDFGWLYGWLERLVWLTMLLGIIWALILNFDKATREYCQVQDGGRNHTPANILPSLSRSMSSFRFGKALWTISSAAIFIARLLSNHFLHRLYVSWYFDSCFNKMFLSLAYFLDTMEILTLVMIPAFSLDCSPDDHVILFIVFISLTFVAEVFQYLTRFLRRRKGIQLFKEDVTRYYRQIGFLILLQLFFIGVMFTGWSLHYKLCGDFWFSLFSFGEYITVVINVRFKRDTVLFVK